MNATQAGLLKELVSALRSKKLNRRNFDMSNWIGCGRALPEKPTLECGTVACAAGLAIATIPSWKEHGFELKYNSLNSHFYPKYEGSTHFDALECGLGVTQSEAEYIFSPSNYTARRPITPEAVASRIRRLLKKYGY